MKVLSLVIAALLGSALALPKPSANGKPTNRRTAINPDEVELLTERRSGLNVPEAVSETSSNRRNVMNLDELDVPLGRRHPQNPKVDENTAGRRTKLHVNNEEISARRSSALNRNIAGTRREAGNEYSAGTRREPANDYSTGTRREPANDHSTGYNSYEPLDNHDMAFNRRGPEDLVNTDHSSFEPLDIHDMTVNRMGPEELLHEGSESINLHAGRNDVRVAPPSDVHESVMDFRIGMKNPDEPTSRNYFRGTSCQPGTTVVRNCILCMCGPNAVAECLHSVCK